MYRGHTLTDAPTSEPITLTEAKSHLGISGTDDDVMLSMMITAARQHAEQMTGLALITQTWTLTLDGWPCGSTAWWDGVREGSISDLYAAGKPAAVTMPRYPLQSITSITVDGTAITVGDTFTVDTQRMPGRIALKSGATLPAVTESANGISIIYVAGFGATATNVPAVLKMGLLQMVASLYANRGDGCSTADAWTDSGASAAFDVYKARAL